MNTERKIEILEKVRERITDTQDSIHFLFYFFLLSSEKIECLNSKKNHIQIYLGSIYTKKFLKMDVDMVYTKECTKKRIAIIDSMILKLKTQLP